MSTALVISQPNRPHQTRRCGYDMPAREFETAAEVLAHSQAVRERFMPKAQQPTVPAHMVRAVILPPPEPEPPKPVAPLPEEAMEPMWRSIVKKVAAKHGTTPKSILSGRRYRQIALARQEAIYHVIIETGLTFPAVGRLFKRDHTSILHCYRQYKKLVDSGEAHKRDFITLDRPLAADAPNKDKCTALVKKTALAYGVTPAQIYGNQRRDDLAKARKEVFLTAYLEYGMNYTEIGKCIGDRDHSSIVKAISHLVTPRAEAA